MEKQVGRPRVNTSKKKSAKVFINLTDTQKKKLMELAELEDLSLSQLCLKALKMTKYL